MNKLSQREIDNFDRDWQEEFWEQVEMYYEMKREGDNWSDLDTLTKQIWWDKYKAHLEHEKELEEMHREARWL